MKHSQTSAVFDVLADAGRLSVLQLCKRAGGLSEDAVNSALVELSERGMVRRVPQNGRWKYELSNRGQWVSELLEELTS